MELEDGGLPSLAEEVGHLGHLGHQELDVPGMRGRSIERSRKVTTLERSGHGILDTSRSPFRHSFVDVRVFFFFSHSRTVCS